VAKAPREFDVQARNPGHTAHIGGEHMVFASVYGSPFVREGDVRRDAMMVDYENFVKLSQAFPQLDSPGGTVVEPNDRPLDSRHLDMVFALQTLSDKPYMGSVISGQNALDTIRMSEILFGSREAIERTPASISLINCNSPLRWDDRMLSAMVEYNRANQAVAVPAHGRDVAGLDPGHAGPADGRGAVRLEGGLVSCYEKFIMDVELLRMLEHEFQPLEVDEASLAFDAHEEVGPGGHFLGAAHTLERFRTCFYRPLLSSTENFDRWQRNGGADAAARAGRIWRETLERYEPPPMDEGVRAQLEDFLVRRRAELGD
jgi:trimethylamine:corrinoid methyltransferase-like protein